MITKVEGVVLSATPYGETSKIINVFTKEYGLIGMICKGAMNIKSKLRVDTQKLSYGYFDIYYKKDKLSTLVSIDVINPLKNIKSDILLISYATYLSDLVYQVLKQSKDQKIYDIFVSALLKIEQGLNPFVITNIVEVKLLEYLGVTLNLTSCISCGNKRNIVTLSSERGGLICHDCYRGEKIISPTVVKLLNMYYLVDINSINEIKIKNDIANTINNFLESYYSDYTGLYLKSKDFLKSIKKL